MRMRLNDDQRMFQESVRGFLASHYGHEARRAIVASAQGYSPEIWRAFAGELGLLGLGFDEQHGGLGGDALDLLAVIEPMGETGVVEPFIETVVLAGRLLRAASGPCATALMRHIVAGDAIVACALEEPDRAGDPAHPRTRIRPAGDQMILNGHKAVVVSAPFASDFLVSATTADGSLALLHLPATTPGIRLQPCRTIDGRRAADMHFDAVTVPPEARLPLADPQAAIGHAIDAAIAACCAEAIGVLAMIVQDTVRHTRERRQFGQPLAHFQVLQHRMADMKIALELATAATYAATARLDDAPATRAAAVSAAKVAVAEACRTIGHGGIQLHGGMGMTEELPLGARVQRATVLARLHGDIDTHLLRLASIDDHGLI